MTSQRISVAVAVFNGEPYISEQLTSIVHQSLPPHEIILSDDGSLDNSLDITRKIVGASDIELKIVRNKYARGFSTNFQSALEQCTGDIILLSDQDDVWLPDKIEKCVASLEADQKYLVIHDMYIGDETLTIGDRTYMEEFLRNGVSLDGYCSGCGMAMKRAMADIVLPFPAQVQDHDIWINEVAKSIGQRSLLSLPLTIYRRHSNNLTTNKIFTPGIFLNLISTIREQRSGVFFNRQAMLLEQSYRRVRERRNMLSRVVDVDALLAELNVRRNIVETRIRCKRLRLIQRIISVIKEYPKSGIGFRHVIKDILIGIATGK